MAKIKTYSNRIAVLSNPLKPSCSDSSSYSRARNKLNPLRELYNTTMWRKLRMQVLKDSLFTCARCGKVEPNTSKLVADHIQPHKGDIGLFWQRHNLQCLCKHCHDSYKQSEEKRFNYK